MDDLRKLECVPCRGNDPGLVSEKINELARQIPKWDLIEEEGVPRLRRVFKFNNFSQALAFANRIGEEAEKEDHHPMLQIEWGRATVVWWTHKINGLHQNDFILAARCDDIYQDFQK